MVPEKCFAVAELCRLQGLLAADAEERRVLFNRALFFYQSCAAELEEELGETIAAHQADLLDVVGDAPVLSPD